MNVDCTASHHIALLTLEALLRVGLPSRRRFLNLKGQLQGRRCRAGRIDEALGQATERASPFAVQPYLKVAIRLLSTGYIPVCGRIAIRFQEGRHGKHARASVFGLCYLER